MIAKHYHTGYRAFLALLIFISVSDVRAQFRPFDNSRTTAPWIYNPSTSFTDKTQGYIGYDGRGSTSLTPQTLIAGFRIPVLYSGRDRRRPAAMAGMQYMSMMQDIVNSSVVNATFAYEVPLSRRVRASLGFGGGISTVKYNYENLVYLDTSDPLLGNGVNFFDIHLNAGISMTLDDRLTFSLAAPYLLKEDKLNLREVIARTSYRAVLTDELSLLVGANLDTYNRNTIVGGDVRLEWIKSFSVLAGADNFKFYSGVAVSVEYLTIGYTYGYNYSKLFSNFSNNQVMLIFGPPKRSGTRRR